jgi:hypothetical protein
LDCGDMPPLSKGRTCLRTLNLVLLKNSRPSKNFSYGALQSACGILQRRALFAGVRVVLK